MRVLERPTSPLLRIAAALILSLATAACGGSGGGFLGIGSQPDLHVDATGGSDQNDGSAAAPFKTITFALSQATIGATVRVAPGHYSIVSGESFPIKVPVGVRLLGDQPNKGKGPVPTMIVGGGLVGNSVEADSTAVLLPGFDSAIGGFVIQNDNPVSSWKRSGILVATSSVRVRHCTIEWNADDGIRYLGGSGFGHVHRNVIRKNGVGMHFVSGGQTMRLNHNSLVDNTEGIRIATPGIDLGGGLAGSEGHNLIAFNTVADLVVVGDMQVDAQDNRWNHAPPTKHVGSDASLVPAGVDIWTQTANAAVDTTGASAELIITWNPPYVITGP